MSDANDYFSSTEVSARLDLVRHLIENSELVPLVRGPSGTGKTLLASRLRQLAPENWSVCHIEAEPTMQPERLLATIARCYGLPDMAGELLQRLVDRFEVLRKRGRIPVLLVDDAQMLPPTSLITLLRLFERQLDGIRLVSIVLFADEQIDLLLSTPQLQVMSPQAIQVIDLPMMTRQEATAYMVFLLKNEGLPEKLALDEVRLNRIYRETKGNPGLLASAILNAVGEEGHQRRAGANLNGYGKQLLVGGLSLLLMVVLIFFWRGISSLFEPESPVISVENAEKEIAPLPAPAAIAQREISTTESAPTEAILPSATDRVVEEGGGSASQIVEEPVVSMEASEQTPKLDVKPDSAPEGERVPGTEATAEERPAVVDRRDDTETVAKRSTEDSAAETDKALAVSARHPTEVSGAATESEAKPQQPDATAEETVVEKETAQPVAQKQTTQAIPRPSPVDEMTEPETADEQDREESGRAWVMSRSSDRYTLQLIAMENLVSMKRYVTRNRLDNEAYIFKMIRKEKPWYILLWGDFADLHSAQQAVSTLPAEVQKQGVWVRNFSTLQQAKSE